MAYSINHLFYEFIHSMNSCYGVLYQSSFVLYGVFYECIEDAIAIRRIQHGIFIEYNTEYKKMIMGWLR